MNIRTTEWDVADFLRTAEDVVDYLDAALAENDPAFFAKALGDVARSRGMADIARQTGLSRESLYKSLSVKGNPSLQTITTVLDALGMRVSVVPKEPVSDVHP